MKLLYFTLLHNSDHFMASIGCVFCFLRGFVVSESRQEGRRSWKQCCGAGRAATARSEGLCAASGSSPTRRWALPQSCCGFLYCQIRFFLPSMWEKVGEDDQRAGELGKSISLICCFLFLSRSLFHWLCFCVCCLYHSVLHCLFAVEAESSVCSMRLHCAVTVAQLFCHLHFTVSQQ